jgi:predicted negative regulator of RcsB-dependent stress response
MNLKTVALFVLLFFIPRFSFPQQVRVDSLCQKAYGEIMALRFVPANRLLKAEKQRYPDNVYVDYLENYRDFLKVFITEDQSLFDRLDNAFDARYDRIKALPDSSRYKNLLLGNMNLQWAFARLKFGGYFTAAWEINRAYRLISDNTEKFPRFVPNGIAFGVLNVMIGLVPDKYRWMLKIISMNGTVEKGKAELYRVLEESSQNRVYAYLYPEALFYLGFIELNFSPNRKAPEKLLHYLYQVDPANLLTDFLKADMAIRFGKNDQALHLLKQAPQDSDYLPFYYLNFLKGDCYLRKLETDSADTEYGYFLRHFKGLNYIKDTWRKRAWVALLQNNLRLYHQRMDSVRVYGHTDVGADKAAETEAESGVVPNPVLLKVRLLFDGGYYRQAEGLLTADTNFFTTKEDKLERIYRLARIAHRQNHISVAKADYRKTLQRGSDSPKYFAANAALKLGEIYESEDSLKQAQKYYQKVLNLHFNEYVNSIRGKAKEALQRISDYSR